MEEMNDQDKMEFYRLGDRILSLYRTSSQNGSKRKIVAAGDNCGNVIFLFQGSKEDSIAVQKFINEELAEMKP